MPDGLAWPVRVRFPRGTKTREALLDRSHNTLVRLNPIATICLPRRFAKEHDEQEQKDDRETTGNEDETSWEGS